MQLLDNAIEICMALIGPLFAGELLL